MTEPESAVLLYVPAQGRVLKAVVVGCIGGWQSGCVLEMCSSSGSQPGGCALQAPLPREEVCAEHV